MQHGDDTGSALPDPSSAAADRPLSTTSGPSQHYREPRPFAGAAGEDVDDWLVHYQRVSRYNRWDPATQLANVVFFLTHTALLWFENHEDTLTTWERFVAEIKQCFGDSVARRRRAEQTLAHRAQLPGETCTTYTEEVLRLCKTINSRMSEEDKVGHLLKGIADDVYNFLIAKEDLTTVTDVIRHVRTFETLKTRRITPKFGRLANVTTVASIDENVHLDLPSTIRQIVREELLRLNPHERHPLPVANDRYLPQRPTTTLLPSVHAADVVASTDYVRPHSDIPLPSLRPEQRYDVRPRAPRNPRRPPRLTPPDTSDRFQDQRFLRPAPICYRCGAPGHISRYCRSRPPLRYQRTTTPAAPNDCHYDTSWPWPPPSHEPFQRDGIRHRSPASDRSYTPPPVSRLRRSPSPRRRSVSPRPEN